MDYYQLYKDGDQLIGKVQACVTVNNISFVRVKAYDNNFQIFPNY